MDDLTTEQARVAKAAAAERAAAADDPDRQRAALKRELAGHLANHDDDGANRVAAELANFDGVETPEAAPTETRRKRTAKK